MNKCTAMLCAAAAISVAALFLLALGYWWGSAEATEDYTGHIPPSPELMTCEPEIENEKIPEPTEVCTPYIPLWESLMTPSTEKEENIKNLPAPAPDAWDRRGPGAVELGAYTVTAYCPCAKCCGPWAENRPVVDGVQIVWTASGAVALEGLTAAVDAASIPLGSALWVEGLGVRIAQDTGGGVTGQHIDLYFADHAAALEWGRQTLTVWMLS